MSGESQRSLNRDNSYSDSRPHAAGRVRLDAGELALPSATSQALYGWCDDDLRRGLKIDKGLTDALQSPPIPSGLLSRLHRLVDQLADAP